MVINFRIIFFSYIYSYHFNKMNLREFNNGTVQQKVWLRPVCGSLTCGTIDAQQQFLEQGVYTSLSNLQGFGVGPHPLLPAGEGSLTILPNTLRTGSTFNVSCKGILSCPAGSTLTFRLKVTTLSSGTFDAVILTMVKIDDSTIKNFSLDFTVACRVDGSKGIAEFQAFGEGYVLVDIGLSPETVARDAAIFDFGTDEALTLQLTAESDSIALNIVSQLGEIRI
jgi:hypothetical protein